MGCATSKQPAVCRNCQAQYSPIRRSYSMHHHPAPSVVEEEDYHIVALTSTTLGSLKLDSIDQSYHYYREDSPTPPLKDEDFSDGDRRTEEFAMGLIEAKTWSQMIDEKIPKFNPRTPVITPPGEPEMIDAWELMEGLEDTSPLRPAHHLRSFSFQFPKPKLQEIGRSPPSSPKPKWLEIAENDSVSYSNRNSNANSIVPEFDPDVISTFREAMKDLSPVNPFLLKPFDREKEPAPAGNQPELEKPAEIDDFNAGEKNRVVLYFTSLRGVRKTYEDCCHVRVILKGTGVRIDERDVSMHSGFKEELKELMEEAAGSGSGGWLPRVFVGRQYIGGAEEIRRLHEEGQLETLLDCCERAVCGGGNGGGCGSDGGGVCEACGDIRFVPCETCSGSCKIYYEEDDYTSSGMSNNSEEEDCEESSEFGFQRCPDCNENGLVRCPICCD